MRRVVVVAAGMLGGAACSLARLDGLAGDPAEDGGPELDASSLDAASLDAPSAEDADADAGVMCGVSGPTEGLLAYYAFDEGSGNVVHDCSGHGLDGMFVRQADGGSWAPGKQGSGVRIQSPNGCVDLGMPTALQAPTMSIAAWLNIATFPTPPASGYIIGQSVNSGNSGWRIGALISSGTSVVEWQNTNGTSAVADDPWPASGWHHLVVSFAPNDHVEVFIDGASSKKVTGNPSITFTAVSMRIGCRADDANYLDGTIDELRIYDHVLGAADIATLATP